ncbi:MAG: YfjI family protein [Candidatus Binataceae bacterium]
MKRKRLTTRDSTKPRRLTVDGAEGSKQESGRDWERAHWQGVVFAAAMDLLRGDPGLCERREDFQLRVGGLCNQPRNKPPAWLNKTALDEAIIEVADRACIDFRKERESAAEGAHASASADNWPEPEEPEVEQLPVPALRAEMLPEPLRPWLCDIAERFQCPLEYVAIPAIIQAGAILGGKLAVRPKREDDWTEYPNLWGIIVGRPGMLKSPALSEALKPISGLERVARETFDQERRLREIDLTAEGAKREALEAELKSLAKKNQPIDLVRNKLLALELKPAIGKRYTYNDATVEKVGILLADNPDGLLLVLDEMAGWLAAISQDDRQAERKFYLTAWAGKSEHSVDRVTRPSIYVPVCRLSLIGCSTPNALEPFIRQAYGGGRDDGMMQRFQLAVYPDLSPEYSNVDRAPDTDARRHALAVFQHLDTLKADEIGAHCDEAGITYLRFAPDAQEIFSRWHETLERRIRAQDEHAIIVAHLGKYRGLVPKLALSFHAIDLVSGLAKGPISLTALTRAIEWSEFLEPHARRNYQVATDPTAGAVALLFKRLKEKKLGPVFALRDVQRKGWTGLNDKRAIEPVVAELEELGCVRRLSASMPQGGRPALRFEVNPKLLTAAVDGREAAAARES